MWAPFMEEITVNYEKEIDHEYTDEIVCPFCGYKFSDSWEYEGDSEDIGLLECDDCNKSFYATRNVSVDYCTEKANYGICNNCKDEDIVIENYTSSLGKYEGLCNKCGCLEIKRMRKEYFDSINVK